PRRDPVVHFKAAVRAAFGASEPVPTFGAEPNRRPAAAMVHHAHTAALCLTGRAARRAPSATARTAAHAGSIRPWLRALAILRLAAGSRRQTASPSALRSSSDGAAFTLPSKTARRKRSISSLPSLYPMPRQTIGQ